MEVIKKCVGDVTETMVITDDGNVTVTNIDHAEEAYMVSLRPDSLQRIEPFRKVTYTVVKDDEPLPVITYNSYNSDVAINFYVIDMTNLSHAEKREQLLAFKKLPSEFITRYVLDESENRLVAYIGKHHRVYGYGYTQTQEPYTVEEVKAELEEILRYLNDTMTIDSWNVEKGYGFGMYNGKRVFIHIKSIMGYMFGAGRGVDLKGWVLAKIRIRETEKGYSLHLGELVS